MNRWKILVALIAVFLLSMTVQAASSKDVIWPAAAIKWENGPLPGTHVAKLWGDWMKGAPQRCCTATDDPVRFARDLRNLFVRLRLRSHGLRTPSRPRCCRRRSAPARPTAADRRRAGRGGDRYDSSAACGPRAPSAPPA